MVFPQDSSHFQHWIFSASQLRQQRRQAIEHATQRVTKQLEEKGVCADGALLLTEHECEYLTSYFISQLLIVCSEKRFDYKITNTAVAFLTRFYLKRSVLEYDPRRILLTCILLAIKTEDLSMSITLHHLCEGLISVKRGVSLATVIDSELGVLDALNFHLLVLQPRTTIHYLTTEYFHSHKMSVTSNAMSVEEKQSAIKTFAKLIADINRDAEQLALRTFENCEIPFEFTPSQIGIACFLQESEGRLAEAEKFVSAMFIASDEKAKLFDSLRPKLLDLRTRLVLMTEARQQENNDERTQKALKSMKKLDKLTKLLKGSNKKEKSNKKQKKSPNSTTEQQAESTTGAIEKPGQATILEELEPALSALASSHISTSSEQQQPDNIIANSQMDIDISG